MYVLSLLVLCHFFVVTAFVVTPFVCHFFERPWHPWRSSTTEHYIRAFCDSRFLISDQQLSQLRFSHQLEHPLTVCRITRWHCQRPAAAVRASSHRLQEHPLALPAARSRRAHILSTVVGALKTFLASSGIPRVQAMWHGSLLSTCPATSSQQLWEH